MKKLRKGVIIMNQTILFTPVGRTDPISAANWQMCMDLITIIRFSEDHSGYLPDNGWNRQTDCCWMFPLVHRQRKWMNTYIKDMMWKFCGSWMKTISQRQKTDAKKFDVRVCFEFGYSIEKGRICGFYPGAYPLFVDLFELILKKQCKIDINDYCKQVKRGNVYLRK